jgi:hypothetical protein
MSRQEYADYMRQGPAAGAGDYGTGSDHGPSPTYGESPESDVPSGDQEQVRTAEPLYAFGGPKEGPPRPPRFKDFAEPDVSSPADLVGPFTPTAPTDKADGASTFIDPERTTLSGNYHELPSRTELPPGLAVHANGEDVGGLQPWGHRTIYPSTQMTFSQFQDVISSLPWRYAGKK